MITCEEYRLIKAKGLEGTTSAERIALPLHIMECPECKAKHEQDMKSVIERMNANPVMTALMVRAIQRLSALDISDPENRASIDKAIEKGKVP